MPNINVQSFNELIKLLESYKDQSVLDHIDEMGTTPLHLYINKCAHILETVNQSTLEQDLKFKHELLVSMSSALTFLATISNLDKTIDKDTALLLFCRRFCRYAVTLLPQGWLDNIIIALATPNNIDLLDANNHSAYDYITGVYTSALYQDAIGIIEYINKLRSGKSFSQHRSRKEITPEKKIPFYRGLENYTNETNTQNELLNCFKRLIKLNPNETDKIYGNFNHALKLINKYNWDLNLIKDAETNKTCLHYFCEYIDCKPYDDNQFKLKFIEEEAKPFIEYLITSGIDLNVKDNFNKEPYFYTRNFPLRAFKIFLKQKRNNAIDMTNIILYLCLKYIAADFETQSYIEKLILNNIKNVDLNDTDRNGNTALDIICSNEKKLPLTLVKALSTKENINRKVEDTLIFFPAPSAMEIIKNYLELEKAIEDIDAYLLKHKDLNEDFLMHLVSIDKTLKLDNFFQHMSKVAIGKMEHLFKQRLRNQITPHDDKVLVGQINKILTIASSHIVDTLKKSENLYYLSFINQSCIPTLDSKANTLIKPLLTAFVDNKQKPETNTYPDIKTILNTNSYIVTLLNSVRSKSVDRPFAQDSKTSTHSTSGHKQVPKKAAIGHKATAKRISAKKSPKKPAVKKGTSTKQPATKKQATTKYVIAKKAPIKKVAIKQRGTKLVPMKQLPTNQIEEQVRIENHLNDRLLIAEKKKIDTHSVIESVPSAFSKDIVVTNATPPTTAPNNELKHQNRVVRNPIEYGEKLAENIYHFGSFLSDNRHLKAPHNILLLLQFLNDYNIEYLLHGEFVHAIIDSLYKLKNSNFTVSKFDMLVSDNFNAKTMFDLLEYALNNGISRMLINSADPNEGYEVYRMKWGEIDLSLTYARQPYLHLIDFKNESFCASLKFIDNNVKYDVYSNSKNALELYRRCQQAKSQLSEDSYKKIDNLQIQNSNCLFSERLTTKNNNLSELNKSERQTGPNAFVFELSSDIDIDCVNLMLTLELGDKKLLKDMDNINGKNELLNCFRNDYFAGFNKWSEIRRQQNLSRNNMGSIKDKDNGSIWYNQVHQIYNLGDRLLGLKNGEQLLCPISINENHFTSLAFLKVDENTVKALYVDTFGDYKYFAARVLRRAISNLNAENLFPKIKLQTYCKPYQSNNDCAIHVWQNLALIAEFEPEHFNIKHLILKIKDNELESGITTTRLRYKMATSLKDKEELKIINEDGLRIAKSLEIKAQRN